MGHLLECGGQVTGGYFAEPGKKDVPGLGHLGFPIVEISEDGSFFVTKIPESGGMVTVETCSEQIVYEIHDPENYLTPDVVADFKQVKFTEVEKDKVKVEGASGKPRTRPSSVPSATRTASSATARSATEAPAAWPAVGWPWTSSRNAWSWWPPACLTS